MVGVKLKGVDGDPHMGRRLSKLMILTRSMSLFCYRLKDPAFDQRVSLT